MQISFPKMTTRTTFFLLIMFRKHRGKKWKEGFLVLSFKVIIIFAFLHSLDHSHRFMTKLWWNTLYICIYRFGSCSLSPVLLVWSPSPPRSSFAPPSFLPSLQGHRERKEGREKWFMISFVAFRSILRWENPPIHSFIPSLLLFIL